jgi:hypothetical protein
MHVLLIVMAVLTQAAEWRSLGRRTVDYRLDRDAVVAIGQGAFRAIRLDVEDGDLDMYDVKVTFANGETFSPGTRIQFREGSRSRVIDLPGAARVIKRVDFSYRSAGRFGRATRATVQVFGRR